MARLNSATSGLINVRVLQKPVRNQSALSFLYQPAVKSLLRTFEEPIMGTKFMRYTLPLHSSKAAFWIC